MTPQIWTRPIFLYDASTPKFHHPMFSRSEVITLIDTQTHKPTHKPRNKQIPAKTSKVLRYAMTLGKNSKCCKHFWSTELLIIIQWKQKAIRPAGADGGGTDAGTAQSTNTQSPVWNQQAAK